MGLSALLHDADDDKLFQTENNANARMFLEETVFSRIKFDQICRVINAVSFQQKSWKHPETLEGKIVQDADRLRCDRAVKLRELFPMVATRATDTVRAFHDVVSIKR